MWMIHVIAGLPERAVAELSRSRKTVFGIQGEIVSRKLDDPSAPYDHDYVDTLLRRTEKKLRELNNTGHDSVGICLWRVERPNLELLENSFFPAAWPHELPWPSGKLSDNKITIAVNSVSTSIKQSFLPKLLFRIALLEEHLRQRDNYTSILLPPRNFGEKEMRSHLKNIRTSIMNYAGSNDKAVRELIDQQVDRFLRPYRRVRRDNRSYVCNERLVFKAPGSCRHGKKWETSAEEGHEAICYLAARVRLGAAFDKAFHYDCEHPRERHRLSGNFEYCHGGPRRWTELKYLNIAPNDYLNARGIANAED